MKKGSKRYLRVVVKALMAWLRTKKDLENEKIAKRNSVVTDLEEGLKLYIEICKAWLIKSIKHPLISLIKESNELNLDFLAAPHNANVSQKEIQNRLMKAKVRLKGILRGVLD